MVCQIPSPLDGRKNYFFSPLTFFGVVRTPTAKKTIIPLFSCLFWGYVHTCTALTLLQISILMCVLAPVRVAGIMNQISTKLRDWAVWQANAGCYSQAALSSIDSKTLYASYGSYRSPIAYVHGLRFFKKRPAATPAILPQIPTAGA